LALNGLPFLKLFISFELIIKISFELIQQKILVQVFKNI